MQLPARKALCIASFATFTALYFFSGALSDWYEAKGLLILNPLTAFFGLVCLVVFLCQAIFLKIEGKKPSSIERFFPYDVWVCAAILPIVAVYYGAISYTYRGYCTFSVGGLNCAIGNFYVFLSHHPDIKVLDDVFHFIIALLCLFSLPAIFLRFLHRKSA